LLDLPSSRRAIVEQRDFKKNLLLRKDVKFNNAARTLFR